MLKSWMMAALLAAGVTAAVPPAVLAAEPPASVAFLPDFQAYQDKARNASAQSNVRTVQLALEMYATDQNGEYPAPATWIKTLTSKGSHYLPGDAMQRSPWGPKKTKRQRNVIDLATLKTPLARAGKPPTKAGTVMGPGHPPTSRDYDACTYGAILYDLDPETQIYTLYVIGKQGDQAIVVSGVTNGDW